MKKYWLVFVVFIPYGLFTEKVEFGNIKIFILNLFGLKATYNSEWWYVRQYIFMMLMFPIINVILDKIMVFSSNMKRLIFCCLIILITAVGLGYWIGNDFF